MGCVYLLTFRNGKRYVGVASTSLDKRMAQHRKAVRGEKGHRAFAVHRAWIKWGEPVLSVILVADDWPSLCATEVATIRDLGTFGPNGYNQTAGGEGTPGRKISEETRAKMRAAKLGRSFSDEHRANLSRAKQGVAKPPRSAEHCAKLRDANRGRAIACSNGLTFAKLTQAEQWLRRNGHPRASVGGLHMAAKRGALAYGFSWKFLGTK